MSNVVSNPVSGINQTISVKPTHYVITPAAIRPKVILHMHEPGQYASVQIQCYIQRITDLLKESLPRDEVKRRLSLQTDVVMLDVHENEKIQASIDLAARLLPMLRTGPIDYGFSGYKELEWERGSIRRLFRAFQVIPGHLVASIEMLKETERYCDWC
jgi:L-ascorbate metabolism protein UlaG (beta-lactamase superfamily)